MPIRRFLPGQAFDQDAIEAMSEAFIDVRKKLGLADVDHPMTRLVARHIIELAQRGIRTKTALYFRTLEEFRANPQLKPPQLGGAPMRCFRRLTTQIAAGRATAASRRDVARHG